MNVIKRIFFFILKGLPALIGGFIFSKYVVPDIGNEYNYEFMVLLIIILSIAIIVLLIFKSFFIKDSFTSSYIEENEGGPYGDNKSLDDIINEAKNERSSK